MTGPAVLSYLKPRVPIYETKSHSINSISVADEAGKIMQQWDGKIPFESFQVDNSS